MKSPNKKNSKKKAHICLKNIYFAYLHENDNNI